METHQTAGCSFIKSERVEGTVSRNEPLRSANEKETSDSDEVSPSATDDGAADPWSNLKCIFCDKSTLRFDDVKLLECLHTACIECINARLNSTSEDRKSGVLCTVCHILSNSLLENHFLIECTLPSSDSQLQSNGDNSRLANIKCTSCHDSLVATSWCVDCNDFLCDVCVQAHRRLKITKEHTIKPKEEADLDNNCHGPVDSKVKSASCPVHPQERLTLYCETCDKLTCRDCQLAEHRQHRYKFIYEIATETRRTISSLLNEVTYKRVLLKSAMKVIDDRQQMIIDKKKDLLNEITQVVVKLTDAITTRGKHLVNKLNEICDSKQKTLNEKKVALEHLSLLTDHCIEFITSALERGSDMAVLKTKTAMLNHLQNVKSKRADIPNPEIPVRIQLALDKANEICQNVGRLGIIIVDGRQYVPQVTYSPQASHPHNQQPVVNHYPPHSQPVDVNNHGAMFVAPPAYSQTRNSAANNANNNMLRAPPVQITVQNLRGTNLRPQYPNLSVYNTNAMPNNNQIKNAPLTGYQQQVTSSTHPQNGLYGNITAGQFDQSLRKLLMNCEKQSANLNNNTLSVRSVNPSMKPAVLYQNADTNSNGRVQSVSPQSGMSHKMQYPPAMNQMYQQPYQLGSSSMQLTMANQPGRSNMVSPGTRQIMSRENSLSPLPQQLQWHTPQLNTSTNNKHVSVSNSSTCHVANDDSFKITLPSCRSKPSVTPPSTGVSVSSSVSKTPSPLNQTKSLPEETEKNLDKVGQDSVNDLMATIARLDSNGIKVIPETNRKPGDSPLVDSSTGPPIDQLLNGRSNSSTLNNTSVVPAEPQKGCDDPNEDWCAVCMDGGELVCCDNCPKVFHINCHIPPLPVLPGETDSWQCMLCTNIMECVSAVSSGSEEKLPEGGLTPKERKIMERMLLELYCQYDPSLHFRDVVSPEIVDYYEKIKEPMCLDMIRKRLSKTSENPYNNLYEIIKDVRLVFKNAYSYNEEGSQVYSDAKTLEEFFDQMLEKWLPVYAFDDSLRLDAAGTGAAAADEHVNDLYEFNDDRLDDPPAAKRCKKALDD